MLQLVVVVAVQGALGAVLATVATLQPDGMTPLAATEQRAVVLEVEVFQRVSAVVEGPRLQERGGPQDSWEPAVGQGGGLLLSLLAYDAVLSVRWTTASRRASSMKWLTQESLTTHQSHRGCFQLAKSSGMAGTSSGSVVMRSKATRTSS